MRFVFASFLALCALAACKTIPQTAGLSARQITVLKENGFSQTGDNWQLGMNDRLLFAVEESGLVASQAERIKRIAGALTGVGIRGARVEGHADASGVKGYNQHLSEKRAIAVRGALVAGGMTEAAIEAVGLGESNPIETNATAAGRQENRRVVIIVTGADVF